MVFLGLTAAYWLQLEMRKDFSTWTERLEGLIVIISVGVLLLAHNSARCILVLSFHLLQGLASGLFLSGLSGQFCFYIVVAVCFALLPCAVQYSCVFCSCALCCSINMQFHRSWCWSGSWWTGSCKQDTVAFFKSLCTHNLFSKQTWCYLISVIRTVLLNSVK